MKREEMEKYRDKLVALRNRLESDVSQLSSEALRNTGEAAGNLSNTPLHLADLGSDASAEDTTLGMLETEQQTLLEVARAVERVNQGTFGRCERCGKDIARERLELLLYTRFCVGCAEAEQNGQE